MSFSTQVKEELNSLQIKSNCCKKAYLLGAMLSADSVENHIALSLSDLGTVEKVTFLLNKIYKIIPTKCIVKRGCFESTELTFESKSLSVFLDLADNFDDNSSFDGIIKCDGCRSAFLRGVFCSSGSVSDPKSSYTLDIRVKNPSRARMIKHVIETWGISAPSLTERRNAICMFYRSESLIEDVLTACGANDALFSFYDAMLKKDFRNRENRATNCVARNISKSVKAASIHISAIKSLISVGAFNELPDDLKMTAKLRMENSDISLSELGELHIPPISKSGLSHRLSKIVDEAKKRKLI